MIFTMNIFENPHAVFTLSKGKYDIYLSGGYSVSLSNDFEVIIGDSITSEKIPLKTTTRFRSRVNGTKAVKLFRIDISKSGSYNVDIIKPEGVVVKKSMLILKNLILGLPKKSEINLIIQRY